MSDRRHPIQSRLSVGERPEPRRFIPRPGVPLTIENIRGHWRPSGSVAGMGCFAVIWETYTATYWAPLHDFAPLDQLRLVESCRQLDQEGQRAPRWHT